MKVLKNNIKLWYILKYNYDIDQYKVKVKVKNKISNINFYYLIFKIEI
jgi:hypothetical protein